MNAGDRFTTRAVDAIVVRRWGTYASLRRTVGLLQREFAAQMGAASKAVYQWVSQAQTVVSILETN
jgi:DNA-binding transcriptional regulator YiaG